MITSTEAPKLYAVIHIDGTVTRLPIESLEDELATLQSVVDGPVQWVPSPTPQLEYLGMYVNEEGMLRDLEYNEVASRLAGQIIVGTAIITGPVDDDGNDNGLLESDIVELGLTFEDE